MNDPLGCVGTSTLSCIASTSWLVPRSKRQIIWFFSVVDGCPEVDDVRRVVVRIVGPLCTLHGEDRIWREQKLFLRARTLARVHPELVSFGGRIEGRREVSPRSCCSRRSSHACTCT